MPPAGGLDGPGAVDDVAHGGALDPGGDPLPNAARTSGQLVGGERWIREDVHIHASAEEVYGLLASLRSHAQWLPRTFRSVEADGDELSFELSLLLRREQVRLSVTAGEAPTLLVLTSGRDAGNGAVPAPDRSPRWRGPCTRRPQARCTSRLRRSIARPEDWWERCWSPCSTTRCGGRRFGTHCGVSSSSWSGATELSVSEATERTVAAVIFDLDGVLVDTEPVHPGGDARADRTGEDIERAIRALHRPRRVQAVDRVHLRDRSRGDRRALQQPRLRGNRARLAGAAARVRSS